MITRERLEAMASEQVRELLEETLERERDAVDALDAAVSAYFPAVDERKRKVEERKADLKKKQDGIAMKIESMKPALVRATVAGDDDALAEIQRTMTELEAQRAAVGTQIEMLSGPLPSCDDAYNAIQTARQEEEIIREQVVADMKLICEFCRDKAQPWVELAEKASSMPRPVSDFHIRRVSEHYQHSCNQ